MISPQAVAANPAQFVKKLKIVAEEPAQNGANEKSLVPAPAREVSDSDRLWRETARGLRYCHKRINANTSKSLEVASFLYALIDLLIEKGVLTEEELNARQHKVAARLVQKFKDSGLGVMYQDPEQDKYAFASEAHVDCENRVQACQAICCKFPFALSKQDVEEGIFKWDFGRPYMIAHDEDGYCVHLDRESRECTVREHRPVPCRGFDCQTYDKLKVWLDFEEKIINPDLFEQSGKGNGVQ